MLTFVSYTSYAFTMFGWSSSVRIEISFRNSCVNSSFFNECMTYFRI